MKPITTIQGNAVRRTDNKTENPTADTANKEIIAFLILNSPPFFLFAYVDI